MTTGMYLGMPATKTKIPRKKLVRAAIAMDASIWAAPYMGEDFCAATFIDAINRILDHRPDIEHQILGQWLESSR